jgi:hypothetical protein
MAAAMAAASEAGLAGRFSFVEAAAEREGWSNSSSHLV